jgi:hypothetical protein
MANTYTLIEGKTLGSNIASVTFTSIPQTYTDLLVKISTRQTTAAVYGIVKLNVNSTSTNQTYKAIFGDGSSATSNNSTTIYVGPGVGANATANTFSNMELYLPNYTSTSIYKSISIDGAGETNATEAYLNLTAGLKSENTAITSLQFICDGSDNYVTNSTFYLYGISNS